MLQPRHAVFRTVRAALACLAVAPCVACGPERFPLALRPDDLLIADLDAGPAQPDGERLGLIFRARAAQGAGAAGATGDAPRSAAGDAGSAATPGAGGLVLTELAHDERWREPVDVLPLPDGTLLVLEQQWTPPPADAATASVPEGTQPPARGAIFRVRHRDGPHELWWSDPRTRQLVALARGADGTLYVSDKDADPAGLGRDTGAVFAIAPGRDGAAGLTRVTAAGQQLVAPGALLARSDGHLLLMDADANPHGLVLPDGRAATPGVLFDVLPDALVALLSPEETVSPIALIERRPGELYLVDANEGTAPGVVGDGAVFRVHLAAPAPALHKLVDSLMQGRPRALVDPAGGDVLADGRLVIADANADPLGLGEDGTKKGVYGTGRGALLVVDPDAASVATLLASERFVSPVAVRRVRP